MTGHAVATLLVGLGGGGGEILFTLENIYGFGGLISACCRIRSFVLFDEESEDVGGGGAGG